jgi:putative flippase GtrA
MKKYKCLNYLWTSVKNKISKKQLFAFIITGLISSLIDILFLFILVEFLAFKVILSTIISLTLATISNYLLSIKYVFETGKLKRTHEITSFFMLAGIGYFLNIGLMYLFFSIIGIYYILARILTLGILFNINFLVKKFIIFKN